jgi:hypothetical protein
MTISEAVAWSDARIVDRWRLLPKPDPSELLTYDAGVAYAQMDADAMSTLADFARMVPDHEAEREAAFRAGWIGRSDVEASNTRPTVDAAWREYQAAQEAGR